MKSASQINYGLHDWRLRLLQLALTSTSGLGFSYAFAQSAIAQSQLTSQLTSQSVNQPSVNPQIITPKRSPTFPQIPQRLPSPDELLKPSVPSPAVPNDNQNNVSGTITVQRFQAIGSSIFSDEELNQVLATFTNRHITFAELLQARSAISDLYISKGYITSGAFIPPQKLAEGVVTIQVVEGSLQEIKV